MSDDDPFREFVEAFGASLGLTPEQIKDARRQAREHPEEVMPLYDLDQPATIVLPVYKPHRNRRS